MVEPLEPRLGFNKSKCSQRLRRIALVRRGSFLPVPFEPWISGELDVIPADGSAGIVVISPT